MNKEQIEQIKREADVAIYEQRLQRFRREGKGYKGLCPFHNDTHPSLEVYRSRDGIWLWKCFPCGTGGDVFELVRRLDNVTFPEAVRNVAEKIGFELAPKKLPEFKFDPTEATARLPEIEKFLANRGIDLEIAEVYKVGAAEIPGLGLSVVMPYGDSSAVKIRAVQPRDGRKFRHLPGKPTADLLYGVEFLNEWTLPLSDYVVVTESELDCLTLVSHGFTAVSVSSATVVVSKDGGLNVNSEHIALLNQAEKIILAFDQDEAGQRCAEVFEQALPEYKTYRLTWPYQKGTLGAVKDVGELYLQKPDTFRERFDGLIREAINRPPAWRKLFKSPDEMETGEGVKFLIKDFLPEGVTFIGALSGAGKTWFALSIARALTTGKNFLGTFGVPEKVPVLYLCPEMGERVLKGRILKMKIPNEGILVRTLQDGAVLKLDDSRLLLAVKNQRPVVILDTAVRFSDAESENDARQNANGLALGIFSLIQAGARGVVGLHHATKASARKPALTLENTLRGSGDIAAMCDAVYGLKVQDDDTLTLKVKCVKPRDFEPPRPFEIQGRPYINQNGDFGMLTEVDFPQYADKAQQLGCCIEANPGANYETLAREIGVSKNSIKSLAAKIGWRKEGLLWVKEKQVGMQPLAKGAK